MTIYSAQFSVRRLWIIFGAAMFVMFGTLLYFGQQIYQAKPPIPALVATTSGQIIYTRAQIEQGQNVWQSTGGMQQGSIWGHGSYVAPDWSADWLHREALALLDILARAEGKGAYPPGAFGIGAAPRLNRIWHGSSTSTAVQYLTASAIRPTPCAWSANRDSSSGREPEK